MKRAEKTLFFLKKTKENERHLSAPNHFPRKFFTEISPFPHRTATKKIHINLPQSTAQKRSVSIK